MSVSKNDITGDSIASRASTQQYRDNYDRIFGNKNIQKEVKDQSVLNPELSNADTKSSILSDQLEYLYTDVMPILSMSSEVDAVKASTLMERLNDNPAPTFRRKDGSLSYHEEPSDEIPFLAQVGGTVDASEWFKKTLTEVTAPPFIPSTPNLVVAAGTITSKLITDTVSESPYKTYFSDRNIPLVYVGPLLDTPIITVENYCKWYSLFAVMPDGKVRKITPEEIEEATDDFSNAWHIDHNFHPLLLNKLAEMFKGEVCSQSLEMVAGRWVMEQMGDPFKFIDPEKYGMTDSCKRSV